MTRLAHALVVLALLAAPAQLVDPGAQAEPAAAAGVTYVVNSTNDRPDIDLIDPACADLAGQCTLRAAIMQANTVSGVNTITVPSGIYLLTRVGLEDAANAGDLDITDPLTIQGAGPGLTVVDGNGLVTNDRVFQVLPSAGDVTLMDLSIRNGSVPTSGVSGVSWGGGILANNPGGFLKLTLNDVDLVDNRALTGGGLYASASTVDLKNTTVRTNAAFAGGAGGGIYAAFGGTLTMQDSQVYSNSAYGGGGLALEGIQTARIERSQFYSNTATGPGGAIANNTTFAFPLSPLTVLDSSLHDNFAGTSGGAISTFSTLVLSRTVVDANHALLNGGGLYAVPGATASLSLQESTLSRNTAQFGGAIEYEGSSGSGGGLTVVNSTLSGNVVSHDGGGLYAISGAQVGLYNATITDNVLSLGHLQTNLLRGGGVFITDTAVITAQNTLIADNLYTDNLTRVVPDDCFATVTSLHSLGYNLIETPDNCLISGTTFGNINNQDPKLGPLQNNGGATETQALLAGSPAIDAAQFLTPGCTRASGAPLVIDQRGWVRPHGAHCDIGAFEYYPPGLFLPLIRK